MNPAGSGRARRHPVRASGTGGRERTAPAPAPAPAPAQPGPRDRARDLLLGHRRVVAAFVLWLLVLASVVSWRRGSIYSGAVDSTVVAKAIIAVVAMAAAALYWRTSTSRRRLSVYPTLIVSVIVVISLIGALTTGAVVPNAVLVIRIAILGVTALLLLSATTTETAVATLLTAMAVVGVLAAATGVGSIHHTGTQAGRLGGGTPALEPNELASLLLPPAIGLLFIVARRGLRTWSLLGVVALAALIGFTGSRTALAMLVLGGLVCLFTSRRIRRTVVLAVAAALAVITAALAFTPLLGQVVLRGEGIGRLLSLNSRTIAWNAALALPKDEPSWWLGHGLSMKTIAVTGQYWASQVFDSSWFSSLAQDGVLGTVLLAVFVVGTVAAVATNRSMRPWALPLVVTIVIRSVVENGLIESSATFALFFVIATAAWPRRRSAAAVDEPAEALDEDDATTRARLAAAV